MNALYLRPFRSRERVHGTIDEWTGVVQAAYSVERMSEREDVPSVGVRARETCVREVSGRLAYDFLHRLPCLCCAYRCQYDECVHFSSLSELGGLTALMHETATCAG